MKKTLQEINIFTDEGKLLMAALAHITTTTHTDKTPDEVVEELSIKAEDMFSKGENTDD